MGNEKLLKEIGARINACRKELAMTQEELAENMEVSIQMISNLENGRKAIRPENLVKLCKCLNVSADYILCGIRAKWEIEEFLDKYSRLSVKNQQLVEMLVDSLIAK